MRGRPDGRLRAFQRFSCVCGSSVWLRPYTVKNGNTSSCGCLHSETISDRMTTHGRTRDHDSAEFRTYRADLTHQRRARVKDQGFEQISADDYATILDRYDGCCWVCDLPLVTVHWDHFQPIAKGGAHGVTNLRPSCQPCNSRKGSLWPFTDDLKTKIAAEVRALRASQSPRGSVTDGLEVICNVNGNG